MVLRLKLGLVARQERKTVSSMSNKVLIRVRVRVRVGIRDSCILSLTECHIYGIKVTVKVLKV
jgi:hypothetical protein